MTESYTRVQLFFRRLQEHRILSILLIFCLCIIGLASFTDSIDKLLQFGKKYIFTSTQQPKQAPSNDIKSISASPINIDTRSVQSKQASSKEIIKSSKEESKKISISPASSLNENLRAKPISSEKGSVDSGQVLGKSKLAQKIMTESKVIPPLAVKISTEKNVASGNNVRASVGVAVAAMRNETTNDRVRSVSALLGSLPEDLNAKEIVLLTGYETTSHREQILQLLVKRTKKRSLDPQELPAILHAETTSNRINCISIIADYIRPPITGEQAAAILGTETFSHRVKALRLIAPILRRPLSDSEVEMILRGTSTSDRTEAIKVLFGGQTRDMQ